MSSLENLCQRLDYKPNNLTLLEQAITHRSFAGDNNERLEFLGDALLDLIIGEALFHQFSDKKEGVLSRYRAELVKGQTLVILEAMKMENEIKAGVDAVVNAIHINEGDTLDQGVLMLEMEA